MRGQSTVQLDLDQRPGLPPVILPPSRAPSEDRWLVTRYLRKEIGERRNGPCLQEVPRGLQSLQNSTGNSRSSPRSAKPPEQYRQFDLSRTKPTMPGLLRTFRGHVIPALDEVEYILDRLF